jgi:hypothetical protein
MGNKLLDRREQAMDRADRALDMEKQGSFIRIGPRCTQKGCNAVCFMSCPFVRVGPMPSETPPVGCVAV